MTIEDATLAQPSDKRIVLVNPNSNSNTTQTMLAIARQSLKQLGYRWSVSGVTATDVPSILLDPTDLALAEKAVELILVDIEQSAERPDAVIIAAFADPGLDCAKAKWNTQATGIGEAALRAGASQGAFAVVTTTPGFEQTIDRYVSKLGCAQQWLGVYLTEGEVSSLMCNESELRMALQQTTDRAVQAGARSIIIGGGPLAQYAEAITCPDGVTIINPISAAMLALTHD